MIDKKKLIRNLKRIKNGTCYGICRNIWLNYAKSKLKSPKNPLSLTSVDRKEIKELIASFKGKRITPKIRKSKSIKYTKRPSPPYSAQNYCGMKKKGNDGHFYISKQNKNGICRWVKCK